MLHLSPQIYDLLQKTVHGDHDRQRAIISEYRAGHSGKTLEIGCGTGLLSKLFERGSYAGADIAEDRIATARALHPGYDFHVVDFTRNYSGLLEEFDTILFHACIHHIDDAGVAHIMDKVEEAVRRRDRPMQMIAIEPCLPDVAVLNPLGFALAKLDRGKYVRSYADTKALFAGRVVRSERFSGPWFWPVPGVAIDVLVQ